MAIRKIPLEGEPRRQFLAEILALYEAGKSVNYIANKYRVSYTGAHRWLRLSGAQFRAPGRPQDQREV